MSLSLYQARFVTLRLPNDYSLLLTHRQPSPDSSFYYSWTNTIPTHYMFHCCWFRLLNSIFDHTLVLKTEWLLQCVSFTNFSHSHFSQPIILLIAFAFVGQSCPFCHVSIKCLFLIDPFVFTITANKNQCQGISLGDIGLKKDCLVVIAIATLGILRSCQGWIILNGRGDGM